MFWSLEEKTETREMTFGCESSRRCLHSRIASGPIPSLYWGFFFIFFMANSLEGSPARWPRKTLA